MSELLNSLEHIENVAKSITSNADDRKNELSAKYKKMTLEFDSILKKQTDDKLSSIKKQFEEEVLLEQNKLQKLADDELIKLNQFYKQNQSKIIEKLFSKVIEVNDE